MTTFNQVEDDSVPQNLSLSLLAQIVKPCKQIGKICEDKSLIYTQQNIHLALLMAWQQWTEVQFASFFSGGFITAIVVNIQERKLAKRTSVQCSMQL